MKMIDGDKLMNEFCKMAEQDGLEEVAGDAAVCIANAYNFGWYWTAACVPDDPCTVLACLTSGEYATMRWYDNEEKWHRASDGMAFEREAVRCWMEIPAAPEAPQA